MANSKKVMAFLVTAVIAGTLSSSEASARHRRHHAIVHQAGCFYRLPSYGVDGCGLPEFSYGQGSCWRRAQAYTRRGPRATRVFICG